jgi:hypothetical protein
VEVPLKQNTAEIVVGQAGDNIASTCDGPAAMCDKCAEIDKTLDRYRRVLLAIDDQITIDRTKELIGDLEAEKVKLHPEQAL